ncbi:MAG TPA: phosphoenolpyruvate--protein phosphotransferase [Vitreimonas sp.]|uniref:phosphoenolpyruvate--protein phosphotransferase n=1 Tax=Vitreimonas sp. TaxID=3069702 RepID=UPI002D2E5C00|nr:phosphoenolpyruvate--protein phosphotransferase [Vitreimonas sp.]HYD85858.1 phosphoenolpyruvate--protein phosphotransferase [Vitreimonas sp.]
MAGPANIGGSRILLRKLREIMETGGEAQQRLDRLVAMVAATMVADVCSIYLTRGVFHELFATQGLDPSAVHRTRLRHGEGLVGLVAETAQPLNIADAPHHERFAYRPETGEDPYMSFLGVPIVRSERTFGVLVVQNRVSRVYGEDEVEALQTIAMVLAEMVASGAFGDLSGLAEVEARASRPELLIGKAFSDGLAIGTAVLHEPHAPLGRVIADDPVREEQRLDAALAQVRQSLSEMIEGDPGRISGVSREVLETFRMLADDPSWEIKLKHGVRAGLSADAAVERIRGEHRAKFNATRDPYLRERLHDLEDLDNRLLRALAGVDGGAAKQVMPDDAILIARELGPAELLDYGAERLRGVALEEGANTSHAAIVARALGVPMVGLLPGLLSRVEAGDAVVLDGERGELRLRPEPQVVSTYRQRISLRSARAAEFARLRDTPAVTRDGERMTLLLNAGLALDVHHLDEAGAEGIGLFRTEFQFMVSETLPRLESQTLLYRDVLETAGERPVTFRTLDLGGDKVLPYVAAEREENPALGWRAVRIGLDRPVLLRYQLRALISAAAGRQLRVMFPLVTTVAEFDAARALVDRELEWCRKHGRTAPARVEVGVMVEAPALAWSIPDLKGRADFLSVGTNDLMQYFFAADRGNQRVSDRYDILSAPALRFLRRIREDADAAGLQISICGEAAGRTLEAMAFAALGYRRLSMPASGIGAVKRLILSLHAGDAAQALDGMLKGNGDSIRAELTAFAHERSYML